MSGETEEVEKEEVHRNVSKFFSYQAKVDHADLYIHLVSDLIAEMARDFREYKRYIDFIEVRNFYSHLMKEAKRIVECIDKAMEREAGEGGRI